VDLRTDAGYRAFIESGVWRVRCVRQIEMAVARLAPVADETEWNEAIETPEPGDPASDVPTG